MSFLTLAVLVTLFKGLFWSLMVPLWHFPDEQAHFGHVAFLVESEDKALGQNNDLAEEIAISETLLGTFRDERGNNLFTFHPEYRIEYTDTYTGVYEEEIATLAAETRTNFVAKESAYYPDFFYKISGFIYKLFYSSNLFIRVFSLRLFWLWLQILFIYLVWEIAKLVFPKKPFLTYTAVAITALQPMLTFVASGVTSDNLHNLLFTAVIYFGLKIINNPNWFNLLGLAVSLGIGLITKQQFNIALVVIAPVVIYAFLKHRIFRLRLIAGMGILVILSLVLAPGYLMSLVWSLLAGNIPYLGVGKDVVVVRPEYGFGEHVIWTVRHTISEVLPWYWGVFNWLGVVLPRWVNRVFMRILVIAGIGLVIKIIKIIKVRKVTKEDWYLIFLVWAAAVYYIALMIWDYFHVRSSGFPFGMQGRYYFPVIVSHMVLLTVGINELGKKIGLWGAYLLIVWFVVAQLVGLYTVASSYYDLSSLNTFIIQASQYKPWFGKGVWLSVSLALYLISLLMLIYFLTRQFLLKLNEK